LFAQLVSKIFTLCGHDPPTSQTDGQTDRQTTCDRMTALCTIEHRAVKTDEVYNIAIHKVCLLYRISATLSCPMKLHKYPLDTQKCPMLFESCE